MAIKNIIMHETRKNEGDKNTVILYRDAENDIDDHANFLSSELSKLFNKTGLSTGNFISPNNDDPETHFVTLLEKYFTNNEFSDFVTFSTSSTDHFKTKLDEKPTSKGGYLWFNHYSHDEKHFLSIVLLRKKNSISISDQLNLEDIQEIDLEKIHMAARINLTAWTGGKNERYIAFKIGKDAKNVTDYFSKFIGCEEYTQAKEDTRNLIEITKKYCEENKFDHVKTEEIKQYVKNQCLEWGKEDKPVLLDKLSTMQIL